MLKPKSMLDIGWWGTIIHFMILNMRLFCCKFFLYRFCCSPTEAPTTEAFSVLERILWFLLYVLRHLQKSAKCLDTAIDYSTVIVIFPF